MNPSLSVSRIINVGVQLTPAAAASQSLNTALFLGVSGIIDTTERYRSYASLPAVALDFGTNAEEYKAATRWFGQTPQPTSLLIGRWAQTASKGGLKCATLSAAQQAIGNFTALANTASLKISKDGAAGVNVTAIALSGVTTLQGVAAAIAAGTGFPAGVTVTYNAVYNRFEFESGTTGATSSVAFLTTAGVGTDLSAVIFGQVGQGGYSYNGVALETAPAAVALFDDMIGQQFYGLSMGGLVPGANAGADTAALLSVAAYIEGASWKHLFAVTSQEAGALVAATTTDIGFQLKALGYKRTTYQFSSSAAHAAMSLLARAVSVNYEAAGSAITLKFKQEPGVVAENLLSSQADTLKAKGYNVFAAFNNGTNIILDGVVASGNYIDEITGTDWLATTVQRDLFNTLYSSNTKIPQTDQGMAVLTAVATARCAQAVANGLVAPGVWNAGGFGTLNQGDFLDKGYYVYISPIATQAQADRAARKAPPMQIAVKLAGAVHSIDCTINVNQ